MGDLCLNKASILANVPLKPELLGRAVKEFAEAATYTDERFFVNQSRRREAQARMLRAKQGNGPLREQDYLAAADLLSACIKDIDSATPVNFSMRAACYRALTQFVGPREATALRSKAQIDDAFASKLQQSFGARGRVANKRRR